MKMGKTLAVTALLCAAVFTFCGCRSVDAAAENKEEKAMNMQDVYQFLKDAGVYYIATVDGDQPRVRPFGTIHIFEGKLYIQTGRKKNVSRQLGVNGKTELCAMKGDE